MSNSLFRPLLPIFGIILLAHPAIGSSTHLVDEAPVSIKRISNDVILVDFGRAAFGNIRLLPSSRTTGEVVVHFGEDFVGGRINRKPKGTVRYNKATVNLDGRSPVVVAPPADKRNTELVSTRKHYHPPAILTPEEWGVVLPFRWVEVEGWKGELKSEQIIRQSAFSSSWDDNAASFESSDDMLNQIWELCRYSIKATTFAGVYVDGDRERIPYEADAYLNQLSHYYTDYDKEMARDTINYMLLDGIGTWPTEWSPHMVFMVYADWMHTGDVGWMSGRYQALKSKLLLHRKGDDGLIFSEDVDMNRTDIVDWPKGERDGYVFTPRNTVVNAFYLRALQKMAEMAKVIGFVDEAKQYEADFEIGYAAFKEQLFSSEKGLFLDGINTDHISSHANLFPLAFGLVPEASRENTAQWLAARGMRCSVYAAQYLMEGLFENGAATEALDLILADNDRSWKHMVNSGTTITWEAWDLKYKRNQDWNHAWGAAPANLLPRYILGAEPLEPGWKPARIRPHVGHLEFAKGTVPTPRGQIAIHWKNGQSFKISLGLPDGMEAKIDLPAIANSQGVYAAGKRVEAQRIGDRWVLDQLVSGDVFLEVK